jgi:hypothetical protein
MGSSWMQQGIRYISSTCIWVVADIWQLRPLSRHWAGVRGSVLQQLSSNQQDFSPTAQ